MSRRMRRPETVRIELAEVRRQAHEALLVRKTPPPTPDEFARSSRALAQAQAQNDWLLVKKHLTAGESRAMFAGMMSADGDAIDRVKVGLSKVLTYLLDWSFTDANDKPLEIAGQPGNVVASLLDNLPADDFGEVLAAIETHMAAMEAERDLEKNATATASASSAT